MEELGRGLVNAPYAAGALVAPALLAGGAPAHCRRAWLPRIADGSALVVLALPGARRALPAGHRVTTPPRRRRAAGRSTGAKSVVPAGDEADAFIVPARRRGAADGSAGIGLFLVERGRGCAVRGYPTQDGARAAELALARDAGHADHAGRQRPCSSTRSTSASPRPAPRPWA